MNRHNQLYTIRRGTGADLPQAVVLIQELAEFENALHEMELSPEELMQDGSGPKPLFDFLVAVADEEVVGLAVVFEAYSTWKGHTLYLEDLVVKQSWRCKGIGRQLMLAAAEEGRKRGVKRLLWQAHATNHAALAFYKSLGAWTDDSWINCGLKL